MSPFFDWFNMGGYSLYVWSAYGLVGAVLMMNVLAIKRQKIKTRQKLRRWFKE